MMWLKQLINGLITKILRIFFKDKKDDFQKTFGLSFNPNLKLKKIPVLFPNENSCFMLANDLGYFEITRIDKESQIVYIRELCTDTEHHLTLDTFELFFIEKEKPDIKDILKKC